MSVPTSEKLAQVIHTTGLFDLEARARRGDFDDFKSASQTPIMDLVYALRGAGHEGLAERAMAGEWDATREEAEAWRASTEGEKAVRTVAKFTKQLKS